MVGPTIVQGGDRISNGNKLPVFALGAYNLPGIVWTRELITDSAHAGEILEKPSGAAGEDTRRLCDDKSTLADSVMEWNPKIAAGVSTDQVAGSTARIIPINMNGGAFLRNIQHVDPGANVNCTSAQCTSSGEQGSLKIVTEMAFETSSTDGGYQHQINTLGTNAAVGTMKLTGLRIIGVNPYYLYQGFYFFYSFFREKIKIRWSIRTIYNFNFFPNYRFIYFCEKFPIFDIGF